MVGEDSEAVADGEAREGSVVAWVAAREEEGWEVAENVVGPLEGEVEAVVGVCWRLAGLILAGWWWWWWDEGVEDRDGRGIATTIAVLVWAFGFSAGGTLSVWAWWWKRLLGFDGLEDGQDPVFQPCFFVRAKGRATSFGGEVFLFEAGEFDESESLLFDHVDESDCFGFLGETFAAFRPEGNLIRWITMLSRRGRDDSERRIQRAASRAVAAFVSADSACMLAGLGSAGMVVVVYVVGRYVSLGCVSCKIDRRSWAVFLM